MRKINILIFWLMICVNVIIFVAYIIFAKNGFIIDDYLHLLLASNIVSVIAYVISYFTILDTVAFRYILMGFTGLIYAALVFLTGFVAGYVAIMAVGLVYLLYFDYRTMQILVYCIIVPINVVNITINIVNGTLSDGTPFQVPFTAMQIVAISCHSIFLLFSLKYVINQNNQKIAELNAANDKTNSLIDNMLDTAIKVKENTKLGTECVDDMDKGTDTSIDIFNKISAGNNANSDSIEVQSDMTLKITELINRVVDDVYVAKEMSKQSLKVLDMNSRSLENIKHKSEDIITSNDKLFNSINKFIDNARQVNVITQGINEISEQTNLLSLNASIESAKAGDTGKGFSVIAQSIRNLANETASLTKNIESIVTTLEKDATNAHLVITEVKQYIDEEKHNIQESMYLQQEIVQDIHNVDNGMEHILASTNDVVKYNNKIEEHIAMLSVETKEVTSYIEEALGICKDNKNKSNITKDVMNKLQDVVQELTSTT